MDTGRQAFNSLLQALRDDRASALTEALKALSLAPMNDASVGNCLRLAMFLHQESAPKHIALSNCDDSMLFAVIDSLKQLSTLEFLTIVHSEEFGMSAEAEIAVAELIRQSTAIKQFEMWGNGGGWELGDESAQAMGHALRHNTSLVSFLYVPDCLSDSSGAAIMAGLAGSTSLKHASFGHPNSKVTFNRRLGFPNSRQGWKRRSHDSLMAFAQHVGGSGTLQSLDLHWDSWDSDGLYAVNQAILAQNTSLMWFALHRQGIFDGDNSDVDDVDLALPAAGRQARNWELHRLCCALEQLSKTKMIGLQTWGASGLRQKVFSYFLPSDGAPARFFQTKGMLIDSKVTQQPCLLRSHVWSGGPLGDTYQ